MSEPLSLEPSSRLAQRVRELEGTNAKLSVLIETGRLLSSEISLERLLALVMKETSRVLSAERSSLFLVDKDRGELYSMVAQGIDDVATPGVTDGAASAGLRFPLTRGIAGHVARTGDVVNIPDAYRDPRFNPEFDRASGFLTRSLLVVPMKNRQGEVLGVVQVLNKTSGEPFNAEDVEVLSALATQAAISYENARLHEHIVKLFDAFVTTIVSAIDARDPTTSGHSHRVAEYSLNLARSVHGAGDPEFADWTFSRDQLKAIRYAAILHDVGKIGVREMVLCKRYTLLVPELALVDERVKRARVEAELAALRAGRPADGEDVLWYASLVELVGRRRYPAPLSAVDRLALERAHHEGLLTQRQFRCLALSEGNLIDDEWIDMRSHVSRSYQLLNQIPWPEALRRVPAIAGSHHEKLDGSGYPRGVKDGEFPFEGQILCVADIFDALTASDRPYKRSYSIPEAQAILEDESRRGKVNGSLVQMFFATGCDTLPPGTPRAPATPPPDPPL